MVIDRNSQYNVKTTRKASKFSQQNLTVYLLEKSYNVGNTEENSRSSSEGGNQNNGNRKFSG